ncbi:hypothetical protein BGX34_005948, partial [Mortierella sp. NVP85]
MSLLVYFVAHLYNSRQLYPGSSSSSGSRPPKAIYAETSGNGLLFEFEMSRTSTSGL